MKKITTIILASLIASVAAAQSGDSFALPKTGGSPNFSVSVGPTYLNASADYFDQDFYGVMANFAWRIDRHNKLQIDIGILGASNNSPYADVTLVALPELFSYNFCLPFGANDQFEFRIAPTVGFYVLAINQDYNYGGSYTDSDVTYAYGCGLGFTWHINKRFFIDATYRYLRTGNTSFDLGYYTEIRSQTTNSYTISFGFKF